ncbi:MAG TPA: type I glyceraldehyde-3-phosphate dehydrogenase [Candidatus Saccharimonadales bacterium]|nr:type I glyceraldehyde-3-phosphate dehydrogenase [Candidatus Saccharimonadales bacterium]
MKTKIAINGFGRIGRNAFKIAFERDDLDVVAVNDLTDTKTLAHLLKHDSNYGAYQHEVKFDDQNLIVDGQNVKVLAEKDPAKLPWRDLGVEVVIESTGLFLEHADLEKHLQAGAKRVVLSAPEKHEVDHDTFLMGVNEHELQPDHQVISNASCTTNCITPLMAILENNFGVEKSMMTTVHSYTASQRLQDAPAKDLREARNAATNIVPTTTGASIAAAKALPVLTDVFGGLSVRVPTPVVSLADIVAITKKNVTVEEVNDAFKKAAADPFYQGIVDVTEEELVSSDFIGNSHSAIVDLKLTNVVAGNMVKVVAWYDNEWGYSNRLVELTAEVAMMLHSENDTSPDTSKYSPVKAVDNSEGPEVVSGSPMQADDGDDTNEEDAKPLIDKPGPPPLVNEKDEKELPLDKHENEHEELLEGPEPLPELPSHASGNNTIHPVENEPTQGLGYVIDYGKSEPKPDMPPKPSVSSGDHKLPPEAKNIDGIRKF